MQIYNESIYDLLGKDNKTALNIRESPLQGTAAFVFKCVPVSLSVACATLGICPLVCRWLVISMTSLSLRLLSGVYVEDLSEFVVRSPDEVMDIINTGRERLVFAETKMNRASSRRRGVPYQCRAPR